MRRSAVFLFALLLLSYAYAHGGMGWNQNARIDLLHAIVVHHTFAIDAYADNTGDKAVFNGHTYSDKAPGIVFLALPAFLVAAAILRIVGIPLDSGQGWQISSWIATVGSVGVLAALGGVALFALLSGFIGYRRALVAVLATFLGSLPFPYAIVLFSHAGTIGLLTIALWAAMRTRPLCFAGWRGWEWVRRVLRTVAEASLGFLLMIVVGMAVFVSPLRGNLALFLLLGKMLFLGWGVLLASALGWLLSFLVIRHRHSHIGGKCTWMADLICGLSCGFAITSEYTAGVAVLGIVVLLFLRGRRRLFLFLCAAALPIAATVLYNWLCFGSLFSIGYSHLEGFGGMREGFFGVRFRPSLDHGLQLLFLPSRGLFYWTPFFLLAFVGIVPLYRAQRALAVVSIVVLVLTVLSISSYAYWDGGRALGPRHLAGVVPFVAVLSGFGLRRLPRIGAALAIFSILLVMSCSLIDPGATMAANPLTDFYLPELLKGHIRTNIGTLLGLKSGWSFLPLFGFIAFASVLLFRMLPADRKRV